MDRALARSGFASRAASLMALLVASTALTAIALAPSAHAGTPQWLGTASSNWFIAGNWSGSPPSVPSAADISTTIDTTTPNTAVINGGAAATQQLVIGNSGNGNLAITNGGGLTTSGFGYLGFFANSTGTVSVDGAGSNWDISSGLTVGHSGTGADDHPWRPRDEHRGYQYRCQCRRNRQCSGRWGRLGPEPELDRYLICRPVRKRYTHHRQWRHRR
ncbi:hypothetical protein XI08_36145 [Bradyrhizobium sp. CCBAU 11361]|nr:hypothetical protein [Bradyrhizobium sp. CCBAU 11361]